jgi:seryl-tRNA synthetase
MIDLNIIREHPEIVRQSMLARQMDPSPVTLVLELDQKRRDLIQVVESLKAERNQVSKEIGRIKDPAERQAKIDEMRLVGDRIAALPFFQRFRIEAAFTDLGNVKGDFAQADLDRLWHVAIGVT